MDLFYLAISATFVNNILLAQYLGNCPFLGVSKKLETAFGMAAAVVFVTLLAGTFTWSVSTYVLRPYDLEFLQTLTFILIIASLVQLVEIILKKQSKTLYNALGVYLPLITTNCAVMGVALLIAKKELAFTEMLVFSGTSAVGYGLALVLFAGIRERLQISAVPQSMQGTAVALVTAGIMALAFMGFQGMAA
ncbi:electron transport complex protein RnfA [Desulfosediminicola flagellatus]|uniref:electron transport complex protein RnfA n=1 Tax=Desulfosediminicola flagellatus TaxID=2569541 RepID=UPI0010AC456D|nr:RnfABCDGE type electron transport complex subunit A [Desulfosediminicola flagellatus]